jgi:hypothetical protein
MARLGRSFPAPPRVTRGPLGIAPVTRIQVPNRGGPGRPMLNKGRTPTTYQITAPPSPRAKLTLPTRRPPVPRQQSPRVFLTPPVVQPLPVHIQPGILAPKPRASLNSQRVPRAFLPPVVVAGTRLLRMRVGVGR